MLDVAAVAPTYNTTAKHNSSAARAASGNAAVASTSTSSPSRCNSPPAPTNNTTARRNSSAPRAALRNIATSHRLNASPATRSSSATRAKSQSVATRHWEKSDKQPASNNNKQKTASTPTRHSAVTRTDASTQTPPAVRRGLPDYDPPTITAIHPAFASEEADAIDAE